MSNSVTEASPTKFSARLQRWFVWLFAAAVLLLGIIFASQLTWLPSTKERNQQTILSLYESVQPGQTKAEIDRILSGRVPEGFLFSKAQDAATWEVSAPIELLATHWSLVIEFQGDPAKKVMIRTSDGPPPVGGPPDKELPQKLRK
jgi:hypothetical protein